MLYLLVKELIKEATGDLSEDLTEKTVNAVTTGTFFFNFSTRYNIKVEIILRVSTVINLSINIKCFNYSSVSPKQV